MKKKFYICRTHDQVMYAENLKHDGGGFYKLSCADSYLKKKRSKEVEGDEVEVFDKAKILISSNNGKSYTDPHIPIKID